MKLFFSASGSPKTVPIFLMRGVKLLLVFASFIIACRDGRSKNCKGLGMSEVERGDMPKGDFAIGEVEMGAEETGCFEGMDTGGDVVVVVVAEVVVDVVGLEGGEGEGAGAGDDVVGVIIIGMLSGSGRGVHKCCVDFERVSAVTAVVVGSFLT
jgi:hypothetical protein